MIAQHIKQSPLSWRRVEINMATETLTESQTNHRISYYERAVKQNILDPIERAERYISEAEYTVALDKARASLDIAEEIYNHEKTLGGFEDQVLPERIREARMKMDEKKRVVKN